MTIREAGYGEVGEDLIVICHCNRSDGMTLLKACDTDDPAAEWRFECEACGATFTGRFREGAEVG
jgi:hypothetical protein